MTQTMKYMEIFSVHSVAWINCPIYNYAIRKLIRFGTCYWPRPFVQKQFCSFYSCYEFRQISPGPLFNEYTCTLKRLNESLFSII